MNLRGELCFRLARWRMRRLKDGAAGRNPAAFDRDAYRRWRAAELASQVRGFVGEDDVRGRDVLDFGCGTGELARLVAGMGARSVTGTDLEEGSIRTAEASAPAPDGLQPRFVLSRDPRRVPFDDASFDVILCFDVLEHVLEYEAVVPEWRRVLRPGGEVLIWWVPWWNPWGPHVESLVPIPWVHVFCPDRTIIDTCARIYEDPVFEPRIWDLDAEGNKKPNKWRHLETLPTVNRLTMGRFEKLARKSAFDIPERRIRGFGGSRWSRLLRPLARVPFVRELFASSVVYRLTPNAE